MTDHQFVSAGPTAAVRIYTNEGASRVPSSATLADAAKVMANDDVGIVVVGDGDTIDGVLSERDVVRLVATGADPTTTRATSVASTRLVWCDAGSTVHEVAEEMMAEYVRHVLVEDAGRLVGIVSARDLLGAYVTADDVALDELAQGDDTEAGDATDDGMEDVDGG